MKRFLKVIPVIALALIAALPLSAAAAADKSAKSEVVMKMGNKVHLFHTVAKYLPKQRLPWATCSLCTGFTVKTSRKKKSVR
jgi:hypothetical protein